MARWPNALFQPVAQHGGTLRPIAVCLHHQAGSGNPASVYASRGVSAHFWLPRSSSVQPVQHVDTAQQAWHGMTSHNQNSIGVETEGCGSPPHADPLTEYQLDQFGALMKWANEVHGVPLVLSESTTTPGLNYHRCAGGPATGCPCDVRVNARAEILRRAGAMVSGSTPSSPSSPSSPAPPAAGSAPPWPGRYLALESPNMTGTDVRTWQAQMSGRGWTIAVDSVYGPQSRDVCTRFQREKALGVDGVVGPETWNASWSAAIT
jgi:N-acetyl-anhydromuramyl-L-alanine amidase AmpD